jgi:uncharacterized membrane protein
LVIDGRVHPEQIGAKDVAGAVAAASAWLQLQPAPPTRPSHVEPKQPENSESQRPGVERHWTRSRRQLHSDDGVGEGGPAMFYGVALLSGILAGSRAFMAPAAVSWAARAGHLLLNGSWLAFMGYAWTAWIFTGLALIELVADQLPWTPSRRSAPQFGARLVTGALSGGTLGASGDTSWKVGLIAGAVGAVFGTHVSADFRARTAKAFGRDRPAALIEDAGAVILGLVVVGALL